MSRVKKSGRKGKPQRRQPARKPATRGGRQSGDRVRGRAKPKPAVAKEAVAQFRVRELNAQEKCGQDTSVERLFRVDEKADDGARAHLVFLDRRHGWYCEHGVECPAVGQAKRIGEADRQHIG